MTYKNDTKKKKKIKITISENKTTTVMSGGRRFFISHLFTDFSASCHFLVGSRLQQ